MNTLLTARLAACPFRRAVAGAAALGALLASGHAAADVPAALAGNDVQAFFVLSKVGNYQTSSDLVSSVVVSNQAGYSQSTLDAQLDLLKASASATPTLNQPTTALAESALTFYFTPTAANGPMPVRISYQMSASAAYESVASAGITFGTSPNSNAHFGVDSDYIDVGYKSPTTEAVDINQFNEVLQPGTTYFILLQATTSATSDYGYCGCSVRGLAQATNDPLITIDPAYLAAHPGAGLEFSPGVGNVGPISPVPEPASASMLLSGMALLGALGAAGRRRR